FLVDAPLLAVSPVLLRRFPGLVADCLTLLERGELFLLGDVDPELRQNRPEILQLTLERVGLLEGPLPFLFLGETIYPFHQHPTVPGPVEDGDLSALRKPPPEAIEIM